MSPHDLLLPLLGLLTGFSLGALGSGGSILALPAFLYAAGLPVKSAVATSLAVVGATSLIGALLALRRCRTCGCPGQEVDARVAGLFGCGGFVGAFVGARLAGLLPDRLQTLLFAIVMLAAATAMLRRCPPSDETVVSPSAQSASLIAPGFIPFLGLGVGLLTGLVGVGGGFLIVPALALFAGVPVKRACATSLWIITANSTTGLLGYIGRAPIAWGWGGAFLLASMVGMTAGQAFARTCAPRRLRAAFAVFLVLVGCFTVVKTLTTPPASHSHSAK